MKTVKRRGFLSGKVSNSLPILVVTHIVVFGAGFILADSLQNKTQFPKSQEVPIVNVQTSNPCNVHSDLTRDNVLIKVNEYRLSKNLPQIGTNETLDMFANLRAQEVLTDVSHSSKYGDVATWLKGTSFKPQDYGITLFHELIASGVQTSCDAVEGWKNSPTHNDALLTQSAFIMGVGVQKGDAVLEIGSK